MIKPYPFELPADHHCEVVGFLYDADDAADLGQDMMEVRLASGFTIDAGWYPEGDPQGTFLVKAWHPQGIELPKQSFTTVAAAAEAIARLVAELQDVASPFWTSSTTDL